VERRPGAVQAQRRVVAVDVEVESDHRLVRVHARAAADDIDSLDKKLRGAGRRMTQTGAAMTAGVTAPMVGAGAAAFQMAADFDASLGKITGLVGVPRDQVQAWRSDVIDLGSTYGKSAVEAADALFFITSAGLRGSDAMDALDRSLRASAVGLGDTEVIADLATSAMNAYASEGLTAAQSTDVLTAAVREGKLEASELAGAMAGTLPVASNLGVRFDEVGAAMAAMSRTGTDAAGAATQLNALLMKILRPSEQGAKALADVGLSAEKLRGQLREKGLLSVLETLKGEFGDNIEAMSLFLDDGEALKAQLDLMGSGAESTRNIFAAMADTTGALDSAFAETSQGSGFKLEKAFAGIKNSLIEFGDVIAPVVSKVSDLISAVAGWLGSLDEGQRTWVVGILAVLAVAGPLLMFLGMLVTGIGSLSVALMFLAANPVVLIVAAIVALIAVIVYVATQTTIFQDTWNWVWGKVLAIASWAVERIRAAWANIRKYLIDPVLSAYSWVTTKIDALVTYARRLPGRISSAVSGMWDGMKSAFRSAINWIISKWNSLSFTLPSVRVPGIGTIGGATIHTPNIPFLAHGGVIQQAGMAVVGEAGPELVHLSRGAQVTPLTGGGGGRGAQDVRLTIDVTGADEDMKRLIRRIVRDDGRGSGAQIAFGRG
jgi:TP901 family phage tail tape measure protein